MAINKDFIIKNGLVVGSTIRIDSAGKFYPANIQGTGAINFLNGPSAQGISVRDIYVGTTYANRTGTAGTVDAIGGYKVGGYEVISSAKNTDFVGLQGQYIGVNNTSNSTKNGISLYGGSGQGSNPTYGMMFTGTAGSGTHGSVTGDWATYLTMSGTAGRGWIFRNQGNTTNVASISNAGNATFDGTISSGAITSSGLLTLNDNYAMINAGTTSNTTLEPVIWARSQIGASIVQMNVQGDEWQFGGGGTLDTTPILKLKYGNNAATFAGTITSGAIDATTSVEEVIRLNTTGNTGAIHFRESDAIRGLIGFSNGTSIFGGADDQDMVFRSEAKLHLVSNVSQLGLTLNGGNATFAGTVDTGGKITITNSAYNNHLRFVRSGQGDLNLSPSANQLLLGGGGFSPASNNAYDLGRTDKYWQDLWLGSTLKMAGSTILDASKQLQNINGIGATTTNTASGSGVGFKFVATDTVVNQAFNGFLIDHNVSGSDTATADRVHIALSVDQDSSATGGDISNEHRIYGIQASSKATGDSDLIRAGNFIGIADQDSGQISSVYGINAIGRASGEATTVNVYGVYGYAQKQNGGDTTAMYGSFGHALIQSSNTGAVTTATGSYGEVQIDSSTTLNTAIGVRSIIDRDNGTINTGYLIRGNYQGTLPTTAWGVYIDTDVPNYFGGSIQTSSLKIGNSTVIDASKNLTNIGTINSGVITATGGNSTNWNTAFGWGNHASASYATQSYVGTQISNLVDSSPAALNTLNELAAALGDDANFSTTVNTNIAAKLPLAGGTMTGTLNMNSNAIQNANLTGASTYLPGHAYSNTHDGTNVYWHIGSASGSTNKQLNLRIYNSSNAYVLNTWNTSGLSLYGNLSLSGTVDGRDVAADGTKLDGIESGATADQSASEILTAIKTVDGSGSGLDADLLDGQHGSYYAIKDHFRHTGESNYTSTTTSALLTEALGKDAFDSKLTAHKTSWSYAGNGNLTDAGRLTELAGTSWLWWTDNSTDNTQGNITGLVIAPTTGGSAGKMFVYNDQGASYAPGWREIWTSTSDGSGSGLDADLLDGIQGASYLRSDADDSFTGNNLLFPTLSLNIANNNGTGSGNTYFRGDSTHFVLGLTSGNTFYLNYGNSAGNLRTEGTITHNSALVGTKPWGNSNDGSGSGLDADLLDGQQGSYYLAWANVTGKPTIPTNNNQLTNGSGYITASGNAATSHAVTGSAFATTSSPGSVLEYQQAASITDTKLAPSTDWHNTIRMGHGNPYSYYSNTLAMQMTGTGVGRIRTQTISNNNALGWREVWDSGNDGSGSGLDADLLDGQQGSSFLLKSGGTLTGTLTTAGNIVVPSNTGLQTSGTETKFTTAHGFIQLGPMNTSHAHIYTDRTNFYFNKTLLYAVGNLMWHAGNDGSGSGLDADTVDGIQGASLLRSDTGDTATGKITFNAGIDGQAIFLSGSQNFDALKQIGFYSLYNVSAGSTNPPPLNYGAMISTNSNASGGMGFQLAHERTGAGTYIRGMNDSGDTWYDWDEIWTSGTDGSGSGLDADLLDGLQLHTGRNNEVNKVVRTDSNGYIQAGWINTTSGATTGTNRIYASNDGYIRYVTPATFISNLGLFTTSNDGAGSGLDADLLDGNQATAFATAAQGTLATNALPKAGGTMTGVLTSNDILVGADSHLQRSNHHSGHLEGSYNNIGANSAKSNPIYTIGSAYNPTDAALSNMYGIGYAHPNASFIGLTGAGGWGMYVAADGDARVWLDGSTGVISSTGQHYVGSSVVWNAGNDGSGSGLDADNLDGSTWSTQTKNVAWRQGTTEAGNNNGLGFWGNTSGAAGSYAIYMSAHNGTYGGRVPGDANNQDYNMYFKMNAGTNRGFVFKNGSTNLFGIDGGGRVQITGDLYGKSVNNAHSALYRFGGIYFTWDSDTYGTNTQHSIRSTDGDTYGDHITLNSFGNVRINFDSNGNGTNYFRIGHHTTGTDGVLLTLDESGNGTFAGNVTAYSDIRLKENIVNVDNALDKVCSMRGIYYNMIEDTTKSRRLGLVAQEVEKVLPEVVIEAKPEDDKESVLSVDYGNIVALLIEGMKEQQEQINQLKKEIRGKFL